MYQKNLGRQIWATLSPMLVYNVVVYIVQLIFCGIIYVQNLDKIAALVGKTPEEVRMAAAKIIYDVIIEYPVEMMGIAALCSVPVLLFMMRKDYKKEIASGILQNTKAPLTKYVLVACISIPFSLGLNNLILYSNLASYSEAYQESAEVFYGADLVIQIVCLGVLTPLVEELIFRGLIYKRVKTMMNNPRNAMIFSSLLFGFYHGNFVQILYGCLSGFLLAYLYEKFGSVKAPILAHILMNLTMLMLTEANTFVWMFENILRMGIITVACAAIASTVFLFIQKIDEKPLKTEEN